MILPNNGIYSIGDMFCFTMKSQSTQKRLCGRHVLLRGLRLTNFPQQVRSTVSELPCPALSSNTASL